MDNSGVSSYLTGISLLPQVPRLRYQFCANYLKNYKQLHLNLEQVRRVTVSLEVLPYCLGAALLAMFDLARDQIAIVTAKTSSEKPGTILELSETERNMLCYRLDSFLDAARRAQNAIVPYLRQKFPNLNFSKSLVKVVDSLEKNTIVLPEPFRTEILDYWNTYGTKLKDYRDLCQHFIIVGTSARVIVQHDSKPVLVFCLPNNPEVRPLSSLCYENPQVHVQHFVWEHFLNLLTFCFTTLERLLDPQIDSALVPALEGITPLTRMGAVWGTEAYIPIDIYDLENSVRGVLNDLRTRLNG